jgi:hypothetical protein
MYCCWLTVTSLTLACAKKKGSDRYMLMTNKRCIPLKICCAYVRLFCAFELMRSYDFLLYWGLHKFVFNKTESLRNGDWWNEVDAAIRTCFWQEIYILSERLSLRQWALPTVSLAKPFSSAHRGCSCVSCDYQNKQRVLHYTVDCWPAGLWHWDSEILLCMTIWYVKFVWFGLPLQKNRVVEYSILFCI